MPGPPRVLLTGLLWLAFLSGTLPPVIAGDRPIKPGRTIKARIPSSGELAVRFRLKPSVSGPIALEVSSLEFDTDLTVERLDPGGQAARVAEDADSGPGTDSRLLLEAVEGRRYRVTVSVGANPACGAAFTLSAMAGGLLKAAPTAEEEKTYWEAVEKQGIDGSRPLCQARGLAGRAALLRTQGASPEAIPLAKEAVALAEKHAGMESPEVASYLIVQGAALRDAGALAEAKAPLDRALEIREKQLGPDQLQVAAVLSEIAEVRYYNGAFEEARQAQARCLAIREKQLPPDDLLVADSLSNLGILLQNLGSFDESRALMERALAIRTRRLGPENPSVGESLQVLGSLLFSMGRLVEARDQTEKALEIFEKSLPPGDDRISTTLSGLGVFYQSLGDYTKARDALRRAVSMVEQSLGPEHPFLGHSLNNLGLLLNEMGSSAEALEILERSLAIREKTLGPDNPYVAYTLGNMGVALANLGRDNEALAAHERAAAIWEKSLGPESGELATSLHNMAFLQMRAGSLDRAAELFERTLAMKGNTLGDTHPSLIHTFENLSVVRRWRGELAEARRLIDRSMAIQAANLGEDHPDSAKSLHNLSVLLYQMGEPLALETALKSDAIATAHLKQTSRSLSESQALRYSTSIYVGRDVALSLLSRPDSPPGSSTGRVWDAVIRSRAVVLDEMAARRHDRSASSAPEVSAAAGRLVEASTRLAKLLVRGPDPQSVDRYKSAVAEARRELERQEEALAGISLPFRRERARGRATLADLNAALPPGQALVAFVRFDRLPSLAEWAALKPARDPDTIPTYIAFVQRAASERPEVVWLGDALPIEAAVAGWRARIQSGAVAAGRGGGKEDAAMREYGTRLRERIWDPIVPALGDAKQVFVVPDGAINLVNLAALPSGRKEYLVETGPTIHYLSAERDLIDPEETPRRGEGLLAFGAPSFDESSLFAALRPGASPAEVASLRGVGAPGFRGARSGCLDFTAVPFPPLPGTAQELEQVAAAWRAQSGTSGQIEQMSGADASETALKASAPGHRVLHLATHGFFLDGQCAAAPAAARGTSLLVPASPTPPTPAPAGENPLLLSGLALAGANHRASAGPEEDDGILTAEEVASLDLSGVEWAVLSACDTGLGEVRAGEGVFGLRRAFQVAGAATVIMSLWPAEDEAARAWMQALYEARFRDHLDTAAAVRQASLSQLAARRKAGLSTSPFFWAGFVAAGDWK